MPDYIPSKFPDRLAWSINLSSKFAAAPTSYGGTSGQATALSALQSTFAASQAAVDDPDTRTSNTILARSMAWDAFAQMARELAQMIQADPAVTPVQKNDLGLTVRDTTRSPVGPPTTKPVVNVERILNLSHVLRIRDEATPTSNRRPPGSAGWEVWAKVGGDAEPLSVGECRYLGLATRVPHTVQFAPGDQNKTVWYLCRAVNGKGEPGPVSDQVSATIAA